MVKVKVANRARKLLGLDLYQRKRVVGTDQRWGLIAATLDPDDRSLLDVGCNMGILTRRAATAGLTSIGVDVLERAVAAARRQHAKVPGLAFMHLNVDPTTIASLPSCDVTLCLSVHHLWITQNGVESGWGMVSTLLRNTRRKMFFEPASIAKKFNTNEQNFTDLDRQSLQDFNTDQLMKAAGPGWRISFLGETECLGPEPFRLLFLAARE